MKRKFKGLLFLLCITLLLPCLTMGVCAVSYGDESDPDDANGPYYDQNGWVYWEYDEATDTIYGLGKEYTYYRPSINLIFDAPKTYYFANEIELYDGDTVLVSYSLNPEIVQWYSDYAVYVTAAGRASLNALQDDRAATYRIKTGSTYYDASAPLDGAVLSEIKKGTETKSFDVRTLQDKIVGNVFGYDGTGAFSCNYGGVYAVSGEYYYIHYMTLGNQYFDADGEFSYRSGTVEAIKMTDEQAQHVATLLSHAEDAGSEIVFEADGDFDEATEKGAIFLFVVFAVLIGFVLPLPLLIVSICMARSAKRGHPTYWYGLTAVCGAWMLVMLLIMIILL